MAKWHWLAAGALACAACGTGGARRDPPLELFEWERGIGVRVVGQEQMAMHLWFYEWNLFDAFERGDLSAGSYALERGVAPDAQSAWIQGEGLRLELAVDGGGVELVLEVENRSDHDWPETAALIACFNPGPPREEPYEMGHHLKTYFVAREGLERLPDREMHFAAELRDELEARSPQLEFQFSKRWPSSERDAVAGLLLRESMHGGWTSGVAWESYVGVQAHNPWLCMHVATRVGPLARGAKARVRGRLYLFPGRPAEGLERHRADFGQAVR